MLESLVCKYRRIVLLFFHSCRFFFFVIIFSRLHIFIQIGLISNTESKQNLQEVRKACWMKEKKRDSSYYMENNKITFAALNQSQISKASRGEMGSKRKGCSNLPLTLRKNCLFRFSTHCCGFRWITTTLRLWIPHSFTYFGSIIIDYYILTKVRPWLLTKQTVWV